MTNDKSPHDQWWTTDSVLKLMPLIIRETIMNVMTNNSKVNQLMIPHDFMHASMAMLALIGWF
jgi:hypothetical protein